VRYYTKTSKELYAKWSECGGNSDKYGDVILMPIFDNTGSLGGLYL